jgi:hypothetical protein
MFTRINSVCYQGSAWAQRSGWLHPSQDGFARIIPESTQSISERDFQYWELVGREKERIRIRQIFHDDVFSSILTAVFSIAAAKTRRMQ